ncbi:MAG: hypothetical protein P8Y80_03030 [Acidobacteriota bacterium]
MKNLFCFLMLTGCVSLFVSCEKSTDILREEAEQAEGISPDFAESFQWHRERAEQGDVLHSSYLVGGMPSVRMFHKIMLKR